MIVRRECDVPMARSKKLLPCKKDCKNCMACIETTSAGERRHCKRHISEFSLYMQEVLGADKEKQLHRWTGSEINRLCEMRTQGCSFKEIASALQKTEASVKAKLRRLKIKKWGGSDEQRNNHDRDWRNPERLP